MPGGDGSTLFLRTTWGILVSRDAGKHWQWICERALGYGGQWDPPIAVTSDGRLWVGLEDGVVSTTDGCDVTRSPEMDGQTLKDFTVDAKGETIFAITAKPDTKPAVWRRPPRGKFEKVGEGPLDVNFMTIDVAPSRPSRVYVTGQPYGTIRGWLFVSDDGGKTLRGDKNDLPTDGPFFLAAVDPKDPNRVLLRRLHTTGSDLVLTKDAGKTFKVVLSMKSGMLGFAKAPDGKTYWAASGLAEHGIFRSTDRGEHFDLVSHHGVICMRWTPGDRLFACENPFTLGAPAIALSTDEGKTMTPIATFADVQGPVACPGGVDAGAAICGASWDEARAAVLPRDAGAGASDAGGRARDAGTSGDAGAGSAPAKRACGCGVVGDRSAPDLAWLITGLLPLAAWARARSTSGSRRPQRDLERST